MCSLRDHVSSHVQVYYIYQRDVTNLLYVSFITQTIVQVLLAIGSSDISVLLRRIHLLWTLQQT